ncbi:MAG TPA: choice-of-anchor P family protein [Solirubrobacteraceae bacterium]|nr:choice-of-anchor P family protein [Solirubrobacteraceae bacterium]
MRHRSALTSAATAALTLLGCASAAAAGSVGGGASALRANANALVAPVSVGALPSVLLPREGGGPFTESLLSANVAGLLPLQAAKVTTEGNAGLGRSQSSASVIEAGLAGLVSVSAARSRCSATADGATASASVADLVVAGIPISTVDAGANTTISLPVGTVVVNEQLRTANGVTVNAVRVSLSALLVTGDIVIAQSRCSVTAGGDTARTRAVRRARAASKR